MDKIIRKCNCGKDLKIEDTKYIGKMDGLKGKVVHLFNCNFCGSTLVIKGIY